MSTSLSKILFCYSPFPNQKEALRVSQALREQKLIACANILGNGLSVFEWQKKILQDSETYVVFKTSKEKSSEFIRALEDLHPYDVPAIVILEAQANLSYAQWVKEQVSS